MHRPVIRQLALAVVLPVALLSIPCMARAAEPPKGGILILDDCDPKFDGTEESTDNLTYIDSTAAVVFRVSDLNGCQTIGSNHSIASDPSRDCVWVLERLGKRIRKFDRAGKELALIADIRASALAVDEETGNLWVLTSKGTIYGDQTRVFDPDGKHVATHEVSGHDIVYDRKSRSFWIASNHLVKISAADGKIRFNDNVADWCASCVAVHPTTGQVWVTVRSHPDIAGSRNQLLRFDNDGELKQTIELGRNDPVQVSVSGKTGSAWVTILRRGVQRYSAEGKLEREYQTEAIATQVDPEGIDAWIATEVDVVRVNPEGKVLKQVLHKGKSLQVWMTGF